MIKTETTLRERVVVDRINTYTCTECNATFTDTSLARYHEDTHNDGLRFEHKDRRGAVWLNTETPWVRHRRWGDSSLTSTEVLWSKPGWYMYVDEEEIYWGERETVTTFKHIDVLIEELKSKFYDMSQDWRSYMDLRKLPEPK